MASLFEIKQRSRARLETSFSQHSSAFGVLIICAIFLLISLLINNKTEFSCQKNHGPPSLNDICYYEQSTLVDSIPGLRLIVPKSWYISKTVFPLRYIKECAVDVERHYDRETETVTYSYQAVLELDKAKYTDLREITQRKEFYTKEQYDNLHNLRLSDLPPVPAGPDYRSTLHSHFPELNSGNSLRFSIGDSEATRSDAERLRGKVMAIIAQYKHNPQQVIHFHNGSSSWLPELFLIVSIILFFIGGFKIDVEEMITLDQDTKTMIVATKTLFGATNNARIITFSQINDIRVKTEYRTHRGGSRHGGDERISTRPVFGAELTFTDHHNRAGRLQMNNHAQRAVRGYVPPTTLPDQTVVNNDTPNDTDEQQQTQNNNNDNDDQTNSILNHNNPNYASEVGDDGEVMLLQRPVPMNDPSRRRGPNATTNADNNNNNNNNNQQQQEATTTIRTIKLLCGKMFEESKSAAVREYVTLFNDWLGDCKRRQEVQDRERDRIYNLVRQLQNNTNPRQQTALASAQQPLDETELNTLLSRRQTAADVGNGLSPRSRLVSRVVGANDDEVEDETPLLFGQEQQQQEDGGAHIDDNHIEEVPVVQVQTPISPAANNTRICCVCLDDTQPVRTVLIPCKHLILCDACAAAVDSCPLCRTKIDYTLEVFF